MTFFKFCTMSKIRKCWPIISSDNFDSVKKTCIKETPGGRITL